MKPARLPLRILFGYATGEGATSLTMNGIANFAMLYYTQVLGLSASYAGLALAITLVWDAVTDPVMGHITDNTRTRWGKRLPYVLVGGVLLAATFLLLWRVPVAFREPTALFGYLLVINLAVRTAVTVFIVPYGALGFELTTDYEERSRLQSVRYFVNQVVNFLGGALAWSIFFRDRTAADGTRLDGTRIEENYGHMGLALAGATLVLIGACVYSMRGYARDNRQGAETVNGLRAFLVDFRGVITDRLALYVFGFFGIVSLGTMLVAQVQMFTYVDFMKFTHLHKTIAHGAGMLAFALGSLVQAWLVVRFDKRQAGYFGVGAGLAGNVLLMVLFIGGLLPPETVWRLGGLEVPVAVLAFAVLQSMWWGGIGLLAPLVISMMADISELNHRRTGVLKDGSYSAMFSFVVKAASAVGMLLNGWALAWIGHEAGAAAQSPEVIRNIAILTFTAGPAVLLLALPILWRYPVDRGFMAAARRGSEASRV
jgi:glycoside/pentoside/hexuronide:cation symporter, GPH family